VRSKRFCHVEAKLGALKLACPVIQYALDFLALVLVSEIGVLGDVTLVSMKVSIASSFSWSVLDTVLESRHPCTKANTRANNKPANNTTHSANESGVGRSVRAACALARNTLEAQKAGADVVHSDVDRHAGKALGVTVGTGATRSARDGGSGAPFPAAAASDARLMRGGDV
jgi:hypothetical protein